MSRAAGPVTEQLLRRVRMEGFVGGPNDLAFTTLSHCQRIVNAGLGRIKSTSTFSLRKEQLVYAYRDQLTTAIDIIAVRDSTRTLQRTDSLADLAAFDPDWYRATGSQHNFWLQLGRDLLIVSPAMTADSTLSIDYTSLTTAFSDFSNASEYNAALELPDEDIDIALGLAEVIMLLRSRAPNVAMERMTEVVKDAQIGQS